MILEMFGLKKKMNDGKEKTYWTRLGRAQKNEDGSYLLFFDYLPAPNTESKITIILKERKEYAIR